MPAPINVFFRPFLALAVALACVLTTQSIQAAEPANGGAMTAGTMMEQCKAMQAHKQQMMADMKAQDTALSEQVAQMNSTTDDKKLGLLAALVTRMAEQRIARDTHMAAMSDEMMKHMMQHMQMGKESMQGCPMMKGMGMNDMKGMGANDMKGKGANNMKGMDDKTSEPAKGQK